MNGKLFLLRCDNDSTGVGSQEGVAITSAETMNEQNELQLRVNEDFVLTALGNRCAKIGSHQS